MILLLLACAGSGNKDDGPVGDDSGGGGGPPAACATWTGFAGVGTTWTYEGNDSADAQNTLITETAGITAKDGNRYTFESSSTTDAPSFGQTKQVTAVYECTDEGLVLWSRDEFLEVAAPYGPPTTTTTLYDCTQPVLELPLDLSVGATWTQTYECTKTYNAEPEPFSDTADCSVKAEGEVTVPAGSWDGREVGCTSSPFGIISYWVGDGVGKTSDTFVELMTWSAGAG